MSGNREQINGLKVKNISQFPVTVGPFSFEPGEVKKGVSKSFLPTFQLKTEFDIIEGDTSSTEHVEANKKKVKREKQSKSIAPIDFTPHEGMSIVIPTYNRVDVLHEAIDSVVEQNHPKYEIVIVDDGSDDQTSEYISKFIDETNCDVVYVRSSTNNYVSAARNLGVKMAKYDILLMLDSDDIARPGSLAAIAYQFHKDPDVDIVYGNYILKYDGETREVEASKWKEGLLAEKGCYILGLRGIRRRVFRTVGLYDEQYKIAEDLDLLVRAEADGAKFVNCNELLTVIRMREDGIQKNSTSEVSSYAQRTRSEYSDRKRGKFSTR